MRERLVTAFVGLTVLVIIAFAGITTYSTSQVVERQQERKLDHSGMLVAAAIADRSSHAEPITPAFLTGLLDSAQRIEYVEPDGETLSVQSADFDQDARDSELRNTRPVPGGGQVTLTRAGSLVDQRVDEALLPMVLAALGLLFVAVALGIFGARRLARPFDELAGFAGMFGRGRFDVRIPHYPVPEAEAIGSAMREAAVELEARIRREREFAANASHQLRTPITALRLELEDLTLWPDTPATVATQLREAIREVDRLGETVNDLLELARGERLQAAAEINLVAVVAEAVDRWGSVAARKAREVTFSDRGPVPVRLPPGPISQVLDVLLENALKHGRGAIGVDVDSPDGLLRVRVRDEGGRPSEASMFHRHVSGAGSDGEGIGLAVATEIAAALGGQLRLEGDRATTFSLLLPRSELRS